MSSNFFVTNCFYYYFLFSNYILFSIVSYCELLTVALDQYSARHAIELLELPINLLNIFLHFFSLAVLRLFNGWIYFLTRVHI